MLVFMLLKHISYDAWTGVVVSIPISYSEGHVIHIHILSKVFSLRLWTWCDSTENLPWPLPFTPFPIKHVGMVIPVYTFIQEIPGSNLDWVTYHPDWDLFVDVPILFTQMHTYYLQIHLDSFKVVFPSRPSPLYNLHCQFEMTWLWVMSR
jgi:hypothetical protein